MRMMSIAFKQAQPVVSFQGNSVGLNVEALFRRSKDKVVFVIGATGTGKSRLAIDLATRVPAEVINSDKMQVYHCLDIATNKVTPEERRGVPHHLLGVVPDPDAPFSPADFSLAAEAAADSVLSRGRLPVVAGGSNSFVEALVDDSPGFRLRRECCFLWVDVEPAVLREFVSERVDRMVAAGLVNEVRELFDPSADYSRGVRRAIGVPELDDLLRAERRGAGADTRARLLGAAVAAIKENTWQLSARQLHKIRRLHAKWGRTDAFRRLDATEVFLRRRRSPDAADEAWERLVAWPGIAAVEDFLYGEESLARRPGSNCPAVAAAAVAR